MAEEKVNGWKFNRQVNLSMIVQIVLLASLIIGSWVNLQRQLDLLQKDVSMLLECQGRFEVKVEQLSVKTIEHEYRLRVMEKETGSGKNQNSGL